MDQCTTYDFLYQKYLSGMKPIIPGALMRKEDFIGMISSELQDFCLIVIDEEFYKRGFIYYRVWTDDIVHCFVPVQDYLISYVKEHPEVDINTIMPNEFNIKAILQVI